MNCPVCLKKHTKYPEECARQVKLHQIITGDDSQYNKFKEYIEKENFRRK